MSKWGICYNGSMVHTRIMRRPLTENEIDLLMKDITFYPDLIYVKKSRLMKYTDAFVFEENGNFVGICAIYDIGDWVKLGPFVFLRAYHGKGYGQKLFAAVVSAYSHKNLFLSSSNGPVQKIVGTLQFDEVQNYLSLPGAIQRFLIGNMYEHVHWKLITEFLKKRFTMSRNARKYYIKKAHSKISKED
jgi:GNAT superfamily N-acetyltransferase